MREHWWRILVSAEGVHRTEGLPHAIDNGVYAVASKIAGERFGKPFKECTSADLAALAKEVAETWNDSRFTAVCELLGHGAVWIVLPDIPAGGAASLERSLAWLEYVHTFAPALLAVQDGMEVSDVLGYLGPDVGVFVGGSTEWKMATIPQWCEAGRERGCVVHVGRVNSVKRISYCAINGATSFDGSGASKFAVEMERLDRGIDTCLVVRR
jgi:hypothetical protein